MKCPPRALGLRRRRECPRTTHAPPLPTLDTTCIERELIRMESVCVAGLKPGRRSLDSLTVVRACGEPLCGFPPTVTEMMILTILRHSRRRARYSLHHRPSSRHLPHRCCCCCCWWWWWSSQSYCFDNEPRRPAACPASALSATRGGQRRGQRSAGHTQGAGAAAATRCSRRKW